MTIEIQIRDFLNHYVIYNDDNSLVYSDDESFLKRNLIDSTSVMELVLYVEEYYQLSVPDSDVIPENFDSISKIAEYVRSRTFESQASERP